jgi:hypothetical protein
LQKAAGAGGFASAGESGFPFHANTDVAKAIEPQTAKLLADASADLFQLANAIP